MPLIATIEADIASVATRVQHAVAWLLGMAAVAQKDVQTLEADSPLVKDAIIAGEAAATAHGVPVAAIVAGAEEVLTIAQQIDAATSPTAAPATPPASAGGAAKVVLMLVGLGLAATLAACSASDLAKFSTATGKVQSAVVGFCKKDQPVAGTVATMTADGVAIADPALAMVGTVTGLVVQDVNGACAGLAPVPPPAAGTKVVVPSTAP